MGQKRPINNRQETAIAARQLRVEALLTVSKNLEPSDRRTLERATKDLVLLRPFDVRRVVGRKNKHVKQDAYRCLSPGGNARYRYAG
ncbi:MULTISPECIES: hypothetical protein [Paenochrobactrum]|uniref:hypothetical protein n=1 Tax=Paenochrobactrum TaxID=999488 RepID=UPI0035BC10E8